MAEDFRTVTVKGHGDFNFPSSMSDDEVGEVLKKQFAPPTPPAGPTALDTFLKAPPALGRQPGQTLQPSAIPFAPLPDASIATAAGKERRRQMNTAKAPQMAAQQEFQSQVDADPTLGFHGATPKPLTPIATPQDIARQSPLATIAQSQADRTREREQLMGLRASGDAATRKAIASRLGAANVAAGGSESDPTGSAALLKQGSETPLLPYALRAFGNPTVDYDSLIKEQLAKQQGDTTGTAIAKGAGRGVYSAVNAQTTPENLALLAGMGLAPESLLSKVAGAGFAAQAGEGAVESGREAFRKIGEGDLGGAAENIVGTGVNAAFATLGGMHVISEVRSGVRGAEPTPEPVTPPAMSPMSPETTPIDQPQAPTERRLSTRKRVSQMTREELENSYVKDALTDQLTGLHNYRAFKEMHEDNPSPVGFSDVDGLKALNDTYGHAAGDALLKAKADALKQAGLEAYRKQGDEFLTRGATGDELRSKLDKANQILANSEVKFTDADGKERTFKGAGFSYGVGDNEAVADAGMNDHKAKREGLGLRARGTLGTMKEVMPPEQEAAPVPSRSFLKDETGAPLSFYRGIQGEFDPTQVGSGHFTTHPGRASNYANGASGKVLVGHVAIDKPAPPDFPLDQRNPEGLKAAGYDGFIEKYESGKIERAIVTSPDQFKHLSTTDQETIRKPQAQIPSPKTPIEPIEDKLRRTIGSVIRTRQLKKAATDRLNVELGLRTVLQTKLPEDVRAEIDAAKKANPNAKTRVSTEENVGALADRKLAPNELKPQRLAMVDAVARALGKTPKDLYAEQYRLSDKEVAQLKNMLRQGTKSMSLKGTGHPEEAFAENAPYPLADINQNNAGMAGVANPKDLWTRLGKEVNARRKGNRGDLMPGAADQASLSPGQMERAGLLKGGGKDIETLMFEHDQMQKVLDDHLKKLNKVLGPLHEEWQNARKGMKEPSKLAQQVAALSRSSKAGLPTGLYAKEHIGTDAAHSTESAKKPEPVQSAEAATSELPAKATTAQLEDKVNGLIQHIHDTHGDKGDAGLQHIHMAVTEKYKNDDNILKAFHFAARKYLANLDKGDEEALPHALADSIDKLPPEAEGTTLYANPVGPILNRIFARRKLSVTAPFPSGPTTLPQSPMADLVAKLDKQPDAGFADSAKAYLANETDKIARVIRDAPDVGKNLFQTVNDAIQAAYKVYAERPGLNPLQWQLGRRQLRLQANALIMHKFADRMNKMHPDVMRREAMVNYLQAGGGVLPERDVLANLKLKENSFANAGAVAKKNLQLKYGYKNAQDLTPEEKQTVANYRAYDAELNRQEDAEGLQLHARENYIRQIWDKDSLAAKQINAVFTAGSFTTNPSFLKMRKFEDYFEGEMAGFTPHRKDFAYLVAARARASAEVLANKELITALYHQTMPNGDKLAVPDGTGVPQGMQRNPDGTATKGALLVKSAIPKQAIAEDGRPYVRINHPSFNNWKWVGKVDGDFLSDGSPAGDTPVMFRGSMLAHPDVAPQLKRILEPSALRQNIFGKTALGVSSVGKQTLLIGLFHPVQLGIHFLEHAAEGDTTSRTMKTLNPFSAPVLNLDTDVNQKLLVMHGLKVADFHAEAIWDDGLMSRGFANGAPIVGKFLSSLHDAMFQRYIPNLKMGMALDALDRNMGRYHDRYRDQILKSNPGLPADSASRMAQSKIHRMTADQMNSAFGGLNWENLPLSKTWQDIARLTVLAPDFLLARMQFVGDSLRPGGMESRKALLIGALVQYTAARAFNAGMNDGDPKWALQDWNKFVVGHHEYSLRTVQGDLVDSLTDPRRFWSHRLNPLTLRPAVEAITQKDVFGHPASAGQELIDFAKNFVPMPLQGGVDAMVGHLDPSKRVGKNDEQIADTILQSLGVQRRKYRSPAQRFVYEKFDSIHAPASTDELAIEQKNTFKRLREKFEEGKLHPDDLGKALRAGTLKPTEVKYLFKTANETQLKREVRQLQPHEALKAFSLGTEQEKFDLAPLILSKLNKFPPMEQSGVAKQVGDFLRNVPKDKLSKLQKAIGDEINYESPPPAAPEPEPEEEAKPQEDDNQ